MLHMRTKLIIPQIKQEVIVNIINQTIHRQVQSTTKSCHVFTVENSMLLLLPVFMEAETAAH